MEPAFDIAIIGAGPGGYETALYAAGNGFSVALIEKGCIGGTCLNTGCIPTKAIRASAQAFTTVKRAGRYGVCMSGEPSISYAEVIARKDKIVETNRKGVEQALRKAGITVFNGHAEVSGENSVLVRESGQSVTARTVIIATGTRVADIGKVVIDHRRVLSSEDILSCSELPSSIIVVGGGVMGSEFACILAAFGVSVTVVEAMSRILPAEDKDVSETLTREMKKQKITVITGRMITQVDSDNGVSVHLDNGDVLTADAVLVTVGRKKNTADIGLGTVGIELAADDSVPVDEHMQTGVPGIYAIGDVTGRKMVAHVASAQGRLVVDSLLGKQSEIDYDHVPMSIFTIPEIGSCGLTEEAAVERNIDYDVKTFLYRGLGKAHAEGELGGLFKLVHDTKDGTILGVHIIGEHASDLIMEGAVAIRCGLTVDDVKSIIHPHPTYSEGMLLAALE